MRVRQLLLETFRRKKTIPIAHVGLLPVYYILYLSFGEYEPFGIYVLVCCGMLLPLLLSNGIFGNDIASGRFRTILTKPVGLGQLYLCRVLGLVIQGTIHLGVVSGILFTWHSLTGNANVSNYGLWALATILLLASFSALSATASIAMKGEHNSLILLFCVLSGFIVSVLALAPLGVVVHQICAGIVPVMNYALPPVALLLNMCRDGAPTCQFAVIINHTALLIAAYSAIGIVTLHRRQYGPQR